MDFTKYLYVLALNPNMPSALKDAQRMTQDEMDKRYKLGVENWLGAVDGWIARNILARQQFVDGGGKPEAFVPDPFTVKPPVRTRIDTTDSGVWDWKEDTAENTPALAALFPKPTLPTYVPPKQTENKGFVSDADKQAAIKAAQDSILLTKVDSCERMLKALTQQFGLKV